MREVSVPAKQGSPAPFVSCLFPDNGAPFNPAPLIPLSSGGHLKWLTYVHCDRARGSLWVDGPYKEDRESHAD